MHPATAPLDQLPPALAATFLAAATRRQLADKQVLFGLESAPAAMFGVVSGRLKVNSFSADGQRFFASQLAAGHWFGEVPLLDQQPRAFEVSAQGDTEVAVLSADAFWRIIDADPAALLVLTRLVCNRYRQALAWIEDASLRSVPARLAARLLAMQAFAGAGSTALQLSQEDLAAQLGVARQTVNRQLKAWERAGLIGLRYAALDIVDGAGLQQVARAAR